MTENEKNKPISEFTEKDKSRLAENLVHALMDENAPDDISDRLQEWFACPVREEEKFTALEKYMSDYLQPEQDMTKESTLRQFNKLAARLGISTSSHYVQAKNKSLWSGMLGRAAAVLLPVIFAVGGYLWYQSAGISFRQGDVAAHHVSVPAEGSRHIVLADGTEVTLNSGSQFDYDGTRQCELHGEGYFNVTKSDEPFVVRTTHLNVTVLGTEFNLSAYDDSDLSVVMLYTGSVKVDYENGTQILKPGRKFTYNHVTREIGITQFDPAAGVRMGTVSLKSTRLTAYSLGEILDAIRQKYSVDIVNVRSIDTTQRYTFVLRDEKEPIETVMNSLKDASGDFDYRIEGNAVIIVPVKK